MSDDSPSCRPNYERQVHDDQFGRVRVSHSGLLPKTATAETRLKRH